MTLTVQTQSLYNAERAVEYWIYGPTFNSVSDVRARLDEIVQSSFYRRQIRVPLPEIYIEPLTDCDAVYKSDPNGHPYNAIAMKPEYARDMVLMHEFAHHICQCHIGNPKKEIHHPAFASVYMKLLKMYAGNSVAKELKHYYHWWGVEYAR